VSQRTVVLELAGDHQIARDLVAGGVFVPGETLAFGDEVALVLRNGDAELSVRATCVWVDGTRGSGLQLVGCDAEMKQQIAALAEGPPASEPASDEPTDAEDDEEIRKAPASIRERLRGLTLAQQIKVAQHGEIQERVLLERIYGKSVWEALLRNPRVTGPEVARIARMGSLPRPLVEVIVGNGGWLQIPEVRRALLSNPRLGTDQILRILRLLPKHELKLAASQTAYPFAVRDAAKRLIREHAGG
jgi:hypothetical protein